MADTNSTYRPAITRYELECNAMDPVGDEATLKADIALQIKRNLRKKLEKK
jgi:hypothetical protein